MAKTQLWQDDYWLLVMQLYLRKPVGVKAMYSRDLVNLSLELHIAPQELFVRECEIANLETPRVERIWQEYGRNPHRLTQAVQKLRQMMGFNSSGGFFEGVEVEETFESDFRPLAEDSRLKPVMLIMILDLYFRLTPITMVKDTPEVRQLASLMAIPTTLVVEVMEAFQCCDPYLNRRRTTASALEQPCRQIWQRYGNTDLKQLSSYASQLKAYFK